jgi:HPr Serine kinase C-terminal domain
MTRYAFHDLTLEVENVGDPQFGLELDRILDELSFERAKDSGGPPHLSLSIRPGENDLVPPPAARDVLRKDGFRGLESGDDFYLTDGASLLRLEPRKGRGEVRLAPSFFRKPLLLRQNFWIFALLKLLRPLGIFGLHAAGLVAEDGTGVLLVGQSGSGKSTLAIALVRSGWRYLSDDAVLLRSRPDGVEALALRRHFYVLGTEADEYEDVFPGEERPDSDGGVRRRIGVEKAFPSQRVAACTPRLVLFPRVSREADSALIALERADALGRLIGQSSPQLFDRATMAPHLATLNALLRQASAFELSAGYDLRENASALSRLLAAAERGEACLASSSS